MSTSNDCANDCALMTLQTDSNGRRVVCGRRVRGAPKCRNAMLSNKTGIVRWYNSSSGKWVVQVTGNIAVRVCAKDLIQISAY